MDNTACAAYRRLHSLNARMSGLHRLQGLDISRGLEYTCAILALADHLPGAVLDVGSYRSPLPAYWAQMECAVTALDMDAAVARQRQWLSRALGEAPVRLNVCLADAARLPFSSSSYDAVSCVSTIEHIPGAGDRQAIREIGRVLKAGGRCFCSVPYARQPREGRWGRWFQRWYNLAEAEQRLVQPSGLLLERSGFLLGGWLGKVADGWYRLPRLLRHSLSWSHRLFFPRALALDAAHEGDARVLWLLLKKA